MLTVVSLQHFWNTHFTLFSWTFGLAWIFSLFMFMGKPVCCLLMETVCDGASASNFIYSIDQSEHNALCIRRECWFVWQAFRHLAGKMPTLAQPIWPKQLYITFKYARCIRIIWVNYFILHSKSVWKEAVHSYIGCKNRCKLQFGVQRFTLLSIISIFYTRYAKIKVKQSAWEMVSLDADL